MTYKEYITAHFHEIGLDHRTFSIHDTYSIERLRTIENPYFQSRVDELLPITLDRQFVRDSFKQSDYTGFIATMLWGGLGSDSNTWRFLVKAMKIDKPVVETKVYRLRELLEKHDYRSAFISVLRGNENSFEGVGISYFTKLLYFLYNEKDGMKPIIFDNWGIYIHFALLLDDHEIDKIHSFYTIKLKKGKWAIGLKYNQQTDLMYAIYEDYCKRMGKLSDYYKLEHPGVLEEYLFGKKLRYKANKNNDNPRFFVKNYVEAQLPTL